MSQQTHSGGRDRINQIQRTAHRVRPSDVGVWTSAESQPLSAADMFVIAPADLRWLVELANTVIASTEPRA